MAKRHKEEKPTSLGRTRVDHFTDTARKRATTAPEFDYANKTTKQRRKWSKDIKEGNIPLSRGSVYGDSIMKKRRKSLAKKTAKRRGEQAKGGAAMMAKRRGDSLFAGAAKKSGRKQVVDTDYLYGSWMKDKKE
jgi:hypothetical protein